MEEKKPNFIQKLKSRWGLESNLQVALVLLVFSITGYSSVMIRGPILNYFEISNTTMEPVLYWILRIGLIFPIYQVMLLVIGTIFGQFSFFWNFQKKTIGRFSRKK